MEEKSIPESSSQRDGQGKQLQMWWTMSFAFSIIALETVLKIFLSEEERKHPTHQDSPSLITNKSVNYALASPTWCGWFFQGKQWGRELSKVKLCTLCLIVINILISSMKWAMFNFVQLLSTPIFLNNITQELVLAQS